MERVACHSKNFKTFVVIVCSTLLVKKTYAELSEISFTEAEVRCAMVMALVHNNSEVDNRTIANTRRVKMRTIQRTRKKLEERKGPCDGEEDLRELQDQD